MTDYKKKYDELLERHSKLAQEKSRLSMMMIMYQSIANCRGLDELIDNILQLSLEMNGGTNIILYYVINEKWYFKDMYGNRGEADMKGDKHLLQVIEHQEYIESIHKLKQDIIGDGMEKINEIDVCTSYFPLKTKNKVTGIVKMEERLVYDDFMTNEMILFFNYVAINLNNEIRNYDELQNAFDELEKHKNNLELMVQERTNELSAANEELKASNEELLKQKNKLEKTLETLRATQVKLIQAEKMASLGVLTAGIAHEINNPINFINSGISALSMALSDFQVLQGHYENINNENVNHEIDKINALKEEINYNRLKDAIPQLIHNVKIGVDRTMQIIKGLRTFSRLDEDNLKSIDIHESIEATLLLLQNRYKNIINIQKTYGDIHQVECYPGKINQLIMNILSNAIDAVLMCNRNSAKCISIETFASKDSDKYFTLKVSDNGSGVPTHILDKIFDPFFTTKEVGKGTGLGLSISQGIVKTHNGQIYCENNADGGATFFIHLPIKQKTR